MPAHVLILIKAVPIWYCVSFSGSSGICVKVGFASTADASENNRLDISQAGSQALNGILGVSAFGLQSRNRNISRTRS